MSANNDVDGRVSILGLTTHTNRSLQLAIVFYIMWFGQMPTEQTWYKCYFLTLIFISFHKHYCIGRCRWLGVPPALHEINIQISISLDLNETMRIFYTLRIFVARFINRSYHLCVHTFTPFGKIPFCPGFMNQIWKVLKNAWNDILITKGR